MWLDVKVPTIKNKLPAKALTLRSWGNNIYRDSLLTHVPLYIIRESESSDKVQEFVDHRLPSSGGVHVVLDVKHSSPVNASRYLKAVMNRFGHCTKLFGIVRIDSITPDEHFIKRMIPFSEDYIDSETNKKTLSRLNNYIENTYWSKSIRQRVVLLGLDPALQKHFTVMIVAGSINSIIDAKGPIILSNSIKEDIEKTSLDLDKVIKIANSRTKNKVYIPRVTHLDQTQYQVFGT